MTTAVQLAQSVAPGVSLGFKNRIINGAMMIDQRNAGAATTPTTWTYQLDRWNTEVSVGSKLTIQQNAGSVTPPAGFTNYMGFTTAVAYSVGSTDTFALHQYIEGFNTADLSWGTSSAQTVTLSFWVRSSLTGMFGGSLKNSASNRSYPFTYTINSSGAWEYKTIVIPGDTTGTWVGATNGVGIVLSFGLGVGATYSGTANSWSANNYNSATGATSVVGTSGATFYITGVQLEVGTAATSFEFRDYGRELIMCFRYFWKSQQEVESVLNWAGNFGIWNFFWPVAMRAAPTCTDLSGNGFSFYPTSFGAKANKAGATSGQAIKPQADAEL